MAGRVCDLRRDMSAWVIVAAAVVAASEVPAAAQADTTPPTATLNQAAGRAYVGAFPLGSARTISSPVPPGLYPFRVTAYNSCGPSQPSAPRVVLVP